jgi:hypothetical protein
VELWQLRYSSTSLSVIISAPSSPAGSTTRSNNIIPEKNIAAMISVPLVEILEKNHSATENVLQRLPGLRMPGVEPFR